ncbi:MAG TPA: phage tail tape measure protein [Azospirillum sp.]|nr:phage tail tape measure protein [Azospirillum sp.]
MANPFDIAVILRLVDQLTGPLGQATAAIEHVDRVAGAAQGLRNMGQQAMMSGAMVSATGAGVAAGFREMLDPAIAFESAMADVNKTLDLDPSKLVELSDQIAAMSTRIPMAAVKLAEITAAAGQAGIARDELLRFTEDAAKMGVAFDVSAGQAGSAMTGLRTIFGLTQDQVVGLGDSINHLSNNMDAKAAEMLNVANRAGSTAKLFGLSGEQLNALSATMLALKSPPEVAATGINALLLKMATADKQNAKFQGGLEAIGMTAEQLKAAVQNDAQGALVSFLDKVKGAPDVMGTLADLFGAEYADDIAKLVGSLDTYKKALGLVADPAAYNGSMLKEYETRSRTTANAIELLGNQTNVLAISLGNLVLPALNDILPHVQALVEGVTAFAKANPEMFRTGMILLALAGAAALVLGPLMMMFGVLATGAGVALSALSVLLGPVGLLAAAVAGAAVLIHRNWDGIAAFFEGLWAGFLDGLAPLQPALDGLAAAVAPILVAGAGLLDWVQSLFAPVDGLAGAAGELGTAWGQALGAMAAGMADPWLVEAAALVTTAWEALPGALDAVGAGLNRLRAWGQEFVAGWISGFQSAFDLSRFTALSEKLGPLGSALGALGTAVAGLFDRLAALFGGMEEAAGGTARLGEMAGQLAGGALNSLVDLIGMVATVVTGLAQAMAGVLSGDFGAVVAGWQTALGGVLTFFESLSQRLTGLSLYDAGAAILQGLADGLSAGASAALAAIEGVGASIIGRFKALLGIASPSTVFAQFGQWIMDGLAGGLAAKVQAVLDTVSGVASGVVGKFKSLLGINSPSTVFAGFGLNLVEGLQNGINDNGADATAAAANLSRLVAAAAAAAAVALPLSVSTATAGMMPDLAAAQAMPMTAIAPLAEQGETIAGGGSGGAAAGGAPVTVNLSVTLDGGDPDVVRRLEEWVRGEGGRLIAEAVRREDERQARTVFDAASHSRGGRGR